MMSTYNMKRGFPSNAILALGAMVATLAGAAWSASSAGEGGQSGTSTPSGIGTAQDLDGGRPQLTTDGAPAGAASVQETLPAVLRVPQDLDGGQAPVVLVVDGGVTIPDEGLVVSDGSPQRLVPVRRCAVRDDNPLAGRKALPNNIVAEVTRNPFIPRTIPVQFHVLMSQDRYEDVSDAAIDAQISRLNTDFAGTGFGFVKQGVKRTVNDDWAKMEIDSIEEMLAKRDLAVTPDQTLNIYVADLSEQRLLGWATFPWSTKKSVQHGVVVHFQTLPGQQYVPYELGRTATHEVGHYLGLYHTFENGCRDPGDEVDDTEFEKDPASGCEKARDTCEGGGKDPTENFMDYSDDNCLTSFTREQIIRMQSQVMASPRRRQLGLGPKVTKFDAKSVRSTLERTAATQAP